MDQIKIIVPHDGVNEIPNGYKPLMTSEGKLVSIVPEDMTKNDVYWIKYSDEQPEKGRLFIMRKIGTEFNTNWKLRVWSIDAIRDFDVSNTEYLYID